ncbi:MAG: ATP-binding protein [Proteobacteria bacterium]|nr:ATP-binding protein [Pseudomonadota bacterium]
MWKIPFSFREFLDYKGVDKPEHLSTKKRYLVQMAFEEYWRTGGFPEVAGLDRRLRIKIHQEYFQALLYRDLIERHDISHPKAITDLAYRLIDNIASMYTVNRLTGYLKSLGYKAPKSAISNYLEWFEDAYFLFTVKRFDASLARSNAIPKKIYCIDHAFVISITPGILVNSGHLLENLVFTALRRIKAEIFYYKTKNGGEVDFVAQNQDNTRFLFQVSETLVDPQTRKREVMALSEAMVELDLDTGTIVTRNEDNQIDVCHGRIVVLPLAGRAIAWQIPVVCHPRERGDPGVGSLNRITANGFPRSRE